MAKEPIQASVWKECESCGGSKYSLLCPECDGEGGYYVDFIVTPTGVVPKVDYLPGE